MICEADIEGLSSCIRVYDPHRAAAISLVITVDLKISFQFLHAATIGREKINRNIGARSECSNII